MKFMRIPLIVLATVGLIALAGCGGDDSTTSSDTSSTAATESSTTATDSTESTTTEASGDALSAEEYGKQAQAIILDFGLSFQQLAQGAQDPKNAGDLVKTIDGLQAQLETTISDFGALQPPEEAQEGHDQILAGLEDLSSKLGDVGNAAESGDKSALTESALALQTAALDFQQQLTEGAQKLSDAGIGVGGSGG